MDVHALTEAERLEARTLIGAVLADINAGHRTASGAVITWLTDLAERLQPISDDELTAMLDQVIRDLRAPSRNR